MTVSYETDDLRALIDEMASRTVVVVGDMLLDHYIFGACDRISPEAPVPVISWRSETTRPGGAGNAAANAASLGSRCHAIGVAGDDADADELERLLTGARASATILRDSGRPTSRKSRIIARGQQIARIDREQLDPIGPAVADDLTRRVREAVEHADAVLVSDYAKGTLTDVVLRAVFESTAERGIPSVVDPKGRDFSKYAGASLITPNSAEAVGASPAAADPRSAGEELSRRLAPASILLTEGSDGMRLLTAGSATVHFPARAQQVYDVTGAGDTVAATVAAALATGADMVDACQLAAIAAGISVRQLGAYAVTADDLRRALDATPPTALHNATDGD